MENANESLDINKNKSKKKNTSSGFADYFSFQKMISLSFFRIIYKIGFAVITLAGIGLIWEGQYDKFDGPIKIFGGIALLFIGNIIWRVICEAWIVFFRIADSLSNIEKKMQ